MVRISNKVYFGIYVSIGTILTIAQLSKLYNSTPNFYVLGVEASHGDNLLIFGNFLITCMILAATIIQYLLFGELRLIEREHLNERSWPLIVGIVMSLTTYYSDENSLFLIVVGGGLVTAKIYHLILSDRLDMLIQHYNSTNNSLNSISQLLLNKIALLVVLFIKIDIAIIKSCIDESFARKSAILLTFSFDFVTLILDMLHSVVKYSADVYEIYHLRRFPEDEVWGSKIWIHSIVKIVLTLIKALIIPVLFTFMLKLGILPINLIISGFSTAIECSRLIKSFYTLIKNSRKLNSLLLEPTEEELKDLDICVICRDDLILNGTGTSRSIPRKLKCGHIFHDGCIRSWLQMSNFCPTCRTEVIANENNETNNVINNDQDIEIAGAIMNGNNHQDDGRNDNLIEDINEREIDTNALNEEAVEAHEGRVLEEQQEEEGEEEEEEGEEAHSPIGNLESTESNGNAYFEDNEESSRRFDRIGKLIRDIGSLNMSTVQRAHWENSNNLYRSMSIRSCPSSTENEFVHELPPETCIPKDWTVFPIRHLNTAEDEREYSVTVNSDRSDRLRMRVVKNRRLFDNQTFERYTKGSD